MEKDVVADGGHSQAFGEEVASLAHQWVLRQQLARLFDSFDQSQRGGGVLSGDVVVNPLQILARFHTEAAVFHHRPFA